VNNLFRIECALNECNILKSVLDNAGSKAKMKDIYDPV